MRITDNAYYSHDEYGRVKTIDVAEKVVFKTEDTTYISGVGQVPLVKEQEEDMFELSAEPADIDLEPPKSDVGTEQNNPN
jgi:hypothetical protein